MKRFSQFLLEGSFNSVVYHGSNSKFDKFDQKKARIPNDFYGGGIAYFTDNLKVGIQYAKGMSTKNGEPRVYTVKLSLKKMFDVDDTFTGKNLIQILPKDVEGFARGARLLKYGVDKFKVLSDLQSGSLTLSGDEVWGGLSSGQVNTANAREYLMAKGYDGLRYNGGDNMGMKVKHNVYLAYYPKSIQIQKVQRVVKKT